jgi:hypothetical protein
MKCLLHHEKDRIPLLWQKRSFNRCENHDFSVTEGEDYPLRCKNVSLYAPEFEQKVPLLSDQTSKPNIRFLQKPVDKGILVMNSGKN